MRVRPPARVAVPPLDPALHLEPAFPFTFRYVAIGALIAVSLAGVALHLFQFVPYWTDDAFISFRYAANLAHGHGPVWNPGEHVEGYTNFGWILLLAAAMKLGVEPEVSARAFGFAATAGTLIAVPLLVAQFRETWTWRWWIVTAGTIVMLTANTGFSVWTYAGLETPALTLLLTAAVALHLWEERTRRDIYLSSIAMVAATLMRPDAVLVWGVMLLFKCARLFDRSDRRGTVGRIALWAAAYAVPVGVYWVWRWTYYGNFFPNTYYLKTGQNSAMWDRGFDYASQFLTAYSMWLLLLAFVPMWRERLTPHRPALFVAAVTGVWTLYVVNAGGDWMPFFRFFVPLLPLIYALIAHTIVETADALSTPGRARNAASVAAAGVISAAALLAFFPHDSATARNPQGLSVNAKGFPGDVDLRVGEEIGGWVRENVPHDWTMAVIASGMVPYYSDVRAIDMLGVNDEHIAHLDQPVGWGPSGHEKHDGGYVISRKPEIIWLGLDIEAEPRRTIEQYYPPYTGSALVINDVTQNPYVWFMYRPVVAKLEHGWISFLLRRDVSLPNVEDSLDAP